MKITHAKFEEVQRLVTEHTTQVVKLNNHIGKLADTLSLVLHELQHSRWQYSMVQADLEFLARRAGV